MTEKRNHITAEQMQQWLDDGYNRVQAELQINKSGAKQILGLVTNMRKKIDDVMKLHRRPYCFDKDLSYICTNFSRAMEEYKLAVEGVDEAAQPLKDFSIALVEAELKKVRKEIETTCEFSDGEDDLFLGLPRGAERISIVDFLANRLSTYFMKLLLKHATEIGVHNYLKLQNRYLVVDNYAHVDKQTINRLNSYIKAFDALKLIEERMIGDFLILFEEVSPLNFFQLRQYILMILSLSKTTCLNADITPRVRDYITVQFDRLIALFEKMTEHEFLFAMPESGAQHKWADELHKKFNNGYDWYLTLVTKHRPERLKPVVADEKQEVLESKPESQKEKEADQPQIIMPTLDDMEATVSFCGSELEERRERLDERIEVVLKWLETLPKSSRNSFRSSEFGSLAMILKDHRCHHPKLVVFALLRLEAYKQRVSLFNGGKTLSVDTNSDIMAGDYEAIFGKLEAVRRTDDRGVIPMVDDLLLEYVAADQASLNKKLLVSQQLQLRIVQLQEFLESKKTEQELLDVNFEAKTAEFNELEQELNAAMVERNYVKIGELGPRLADLTKVLESLEREKIQLGCSIDDLSAELSEAEGAAEPAAVGEPALHENQRLEFERELAVLVERSKLTNDEL